jgi:hypothetical protein
MYKCLISKNVNEADKEVCSNCLNEAWENADDIICFEMEEKGFCDDVAACADDTCHSDCSNEVHAKMSCYTNASWCGGYGIECLSGNELPCHDEYIDFYGCKESNGKSFEDWHACMTCLHDAFVDLIDSAATCSELAESSYCDAVQSCADGDCNNECSNELHILEACKMDSAECEDAYDSECLTGM